MTIDAALVAFAVIAGLLTITPGADTILVIRNVMARGRRGGLLTAVGVSCGVCVHAMLSALGLSLILVRSATAYELVKMGGAAYLVWLGARSLRAALGRELSRPPDTDDRGPHARPTRDRSSFAEGILCNVLNPKAALFYFAFLPQFMRPEDWVLGKSMLLAGVHSAEVILWYSVVTLFVARLRGWIHRPQVKRSIEATTGVIMIALGVRLAMERAR